MDKIKVLYVVSTLRNSGPTNQLLGKISNLDRSKFEYTVLRLSPNPESNREKDFLASDITVDTLGLSRVQFQLIGKSQLKRYIAKYKPDIVHTTGVRADNMVSKLNLKDAKHCMTIRNYVYDDYPIKYGKILGYLLARNHIKAMHNCDFPITCSKSLKAMYTEILDQKLYVVQNGVNTERFSPPSNIMGKLELREKLKLPKDKTIFITVGSLIKRKDPITVIEAFNKIDNGTHSVLLILGDGKLMEESRKKSGENVIFRGNVKNVNDYLKASDIYVSASESEGLPNTVLEAGRSGLNIILSDIPQHREVFENELDYITLFNVGDEIALSEAMDNQSNDLINFEISEYIKDNFSNKIMSHKYEEIYQLIMKQ